MALVFPSDLAQWSQWQGSQHWLRHVRHSIAPAKPHRFFLYTSHPHPRLLVSLDATTPTAVAAFLKPVSQLATLGVAILSSSDLSSILGSEWETILFSCSETDALSELSNWPNITAVFSGGHYLAAGYLSWQFAQHENMPYVVAQHGLTTPFAPPLPLGAHLLAFSEQDARFWISGREDLTSEVVGGQLFWEAQQRKITSLESDRPVFLGQLHGAELSRSISAQSAQKFCVQTGAIYRPHPSENDILSRIQHARWSRQGIEIDRSGSLLLEHPRPVVSIFSTGVLEAAAAGIPAWVTVSKPVDWVSELWQRYGLSPWGEKPTPSPVINDTEPAKLSAAAISRIIGEL